jgi:hypothetical protein
MRPHHHHPVAAGGTAEAPYFRSGAGGVVMGCYCFGDGLVLVLLNVLSYRCAINARSLRYLFAIAAESMDKCFVFAAQSVFISV